MSKVWLVTGSSRGLGRALAEAALEAGHRVVATARRVGDLDALVAAHPQRALAVALDVRRAEDARSAVSAAVATFGGLDVVVNNAGYANTSAIEDVDESDFRAQIETNFFGTFHVTRAALPVLRNQKAGHVIQVSSMGGRLGTAGLGAYQSAKWAVEGFSEVLAREVGPLGIRVTIVEPGGFATDWGGASMRIDEPSEPYRATVGAVAARLRGDQGAMRGDPARAAQAILEIARVDDPPLRLLLGSDAVFLADVVTQGRLREDAKWKHLAVSTDAEGIVPFEQTEVAKILREQWR